jgi:two-component system, LytTR family, response regulator
MSKMAAASEAFEVIRVLLVDDEELARDRLCQLLGPFADFEVAGVAADAEEAMEKIQALVPDLVFLDIQMPGCSGLELAASLPSPRPQIVFCTAYDQYAVDAFELHAVDYLLKPVSRVRLAKCLERVRTQAAHLTDAFLQQVATQAGAPAPVRFLAKRGSRFRVVPQSEVLFFSFQDGQTKLHSTGHEYWMQPSLSDLEKRLEHRVFFRISRAVIVNLDAIQEVLPLMGGYGQVVLKGGARLEVSRRRLKDLISRLES